MWQLYCQDGAAGAEFRQLQSSQGAVRAWAWNMSRMLMRHLATQPQPLALSADCQPPLLDGLRSLHPTLAHTLSRSARSASVSLKIINMRLKGWSGRLCGGGHLYIILSSSWIVFSCQTWNTWRLMSWFSHYLQFFPLRKCISHAGNYIIGFHVIGERRATHIVTLQKHAARSLSTLQKASFSKKMYTYTHTPTQICSWTLMH